MTIRRRLLLWSAAVVFPAPLGYLYDFSAAEPVGLKRIILFGIIAYSWWLLAVLLSVRPRWLDRFVGLPAVYGLHGMLGVLALVLAYLHRENSYTGDALARTLGDWAFFGSIGVLLLAVFFLSGWLVDRSRLVMRVKRALEAVGLQHRLSVWVHRLNLLIIAMIFLHAHLLVRVNQYFAFMVLLDLYTVAVFTVYAWRRWIAPDAFQTGVVVSNEPRGSTSRRIAIELDRPSVAVRPGDYFFVGFEGAAAVGDERHPFSVTDDDEQVVTFTVRQLGDHTGRLGGLPVGTRARLEGPFGRFESIVRAHDPQDPLVLLGMGAGVAPLLSLTAAHHTTRPIHLLWAVRSAEDAYYRDVLADYEAASAGRLRVTTSVGRFHRDDLARLLPEQTLRTAAFFIVGPNPAVLASQRMLRRLGVQAGRIHQERLTM